MKFLHDVKECTRADTELAIKAFLCVISETTPIMSKKKWKDHVQSTNDKRLPKHKLNYRAIERRSVGRLKRRWSDIRRWNTQMHNPCREDV